MRMYAACLSSYNNGCLHGEWFDLEDYEDTEALKRDIAIKVLRTSPHPNVTVTCPACEGSKPEQFFCMCCDKTGKVESSEEWAAHDYDGEGLSSFGEYPNLEKLLDHVRLISEHGDAWLAYVEWQGAHNATEENFLDLRMGECESARDYFEEQLEQSGLLNHVPAELRYYIDFEQYAKDMECNGGYHFEEYNGTTFVFSS